MDKKTGEELVKKELLSKVDEKDNTKPLDKLPAVTTEQGLLFAKEKVENATLDGAKLKYEGNTIIGSGVHIQICMRLSMTQLTTM